MKYKYFYVRQRAKAQVSASTGNHYAERFILDRFTKSRWN
jgi:hypothetical protein